MSEFLFARPNFLSGVGSIIDIFGTNQEYNTSISPQVADSRAMNADIMALRNDASIAFSKVIDNVEA